MDAPMEASDKSREMARLKMKKRRPIGSESSLLYLFVCLLFGQRHWTLGSVNYWSRCNSAPPPFCFLSRGSNLKKKY